MLPCVFGPSGQCDSFVRSGDSQVFTNGLAPVPGTLYVSGSRMAKPLSSWTILARSPSAGLPLRFHFRGLCTFPMHLRARLLGNNAYSALRNGMRARETASLTPLQGPGTDAFCGPSSISGSLVHHCRNVPRTAGRAICSMWCSPFKSVSQSTFCSQVSLFRPCSLRPSWGAL